MRRVAQSISDRTTTCCLVGIQEEVVLTTERYLFLAAIGPVQDFIASARRSRDLWFGSWVLSELSKAVAEEIARQGGEGGLIFPAPQAFADLTPGSDLNVANKIVAEISQPPGALAADLKKALDMRLVTIRDEAFKGVKGPFHVEVANAQVADLVEFYWAALPLSGADRYRQQRDLLERLLGAQKNTRGFRPPSWSAPVSKSSLDGEREAVIPPERYPARREPEEVQHRKVAQLYKDYKTRRGELLSGVDLLKRHGNRSADESHFPSTSHIAALPLIQGLDRDAGTTRPSWEAYIRRLKALKAFEAEYIPTAYSGVVTGQYDGSLLFAERLAESLEGPDLKTAQAALDDFLRVATAGQRPLPYYGLLLADGDGMGKAIDAQKDATDHRGLSQALNHFAQRVPKIVATHRGALVYAGGDDVLAFVPLHTGLACVRALADAFASDLSGFAYQDDNGQTSSPTLSAGLVLSHHIEPLSDALTLARAAERRAKQVPGKQALAVTMSKRGGVDRTVVGHWGEVDERLARFSALHRAEAIPDGMAYEWQDLERRIGRPKGDPDVPRAQAAMRHEARRILRRKQARRGLERIALTSQEWLDQQINNTNLPLAQLADEVVIARLFAHALDLAEGELVAQKVPT